MEVYTKEARIILAIKAICISKKLSQRSAAKIYNIPYLILYHRMSGRTPCCETKANCLKLTELEEEIIVRYILDLDDRGFGPRLGSVEDMANYLLENQGGKHVGKL